ncbi:MAG: hypothetical protein ACKOX3_05095 [Bacteroidota bacterium]
MKKLKQVLVLLCISVMSYNTNAQFVPPVIQDSSYGVNSVYSRKTGCDIYYFNDSVIYRASVWEQDSVGKGFGYVVDYNGTRYKGTLPFYCTDHVLNADVCLLKNSSNTITAAVVYNEYNKNNYFLEYFEWKPSLHDFVSVYVDTIFSTSTGTTLNIDGNSSVDGEFAIVWDDNDSIIYYVVGSIANGVNNTKVLTYGISPDVSMYFDGSNDVVHVVYIDTLNYELTVADYNYSDLLSNITGPLAIQSVAPTTNLKWALPRIASPGPNAGSINEWTIIALECDTSNWYVLGFNNNLGTRIPYNYMPAPNKLYKVPNYDLSVCYSNNYPTDGIYVGWAFESDSLNINLPPTNLVQLANYSIVLRCSNTAIKLDTAYWQVSSSITNNNNDFSSFLSIASRHGSDELFATYQNMVIDSNYIYDINYKSIVPISSATSLKTSNISMNPNRKIIGIRGYDTSGKLLFVKTSINEEEIQFNIPNECCEQIIFIKFIFDDMTYITNKYFINTSNTYFLK